MSVEHVHVCRANSHRISTCVFEFSMCFILRDFLEMKSTNSDEDAIIPAALLPQKPPEARRSPNPRQQSPIHTSSAPLTPRPRSSSLSGAVSPRLSAISNPESPLRRVMGNLPFITSPRGGSPLPARQRGSPLMMERGASPMLHARGASPLVSHRPSDAPSGVFGAGMIFPLYFLPALHYS